MAVKDRLPVIVGTQARYFFISLTYRHPRMGVLVWLHSATMTVCPCSVSFEESFRRMYPETTFPGHPQMVLLPGVEALSSTKSFDCGITRGQRICSEKNRSKVDFHQTRHFPSAFGPRRLTGHPRHNELHDSKFWAYQWACLPLRIHPCLFQFLRNTDAPSPSKLRVDLTQERFFRRAGDFVRLIPIILADVQYGCQHHKQDTKSEQEKNQRDIHQAKPAFRPPCDAQLVWRLAHPARIPRGG